jgi:hypothetical protein
MTILGFQVALLDEHGKELQRIPDVYQGSSHLVIGEHGYVFKRQAEEEQQQVRYFQRVPIFDRLKLATDGNAQN